MRALACATLLLAVSSASAKPPPVDYKDPPPSETPAPFPYPGPYQNVPAIDESRWAPLPPSKEPWWSFGKLDPVLTEACRIGDFVSLPLNRIILQFQGEKGRAMMQVVPAAYRQLLVDRRKLARPGVTYYFYDTASPDCEVRVDAKTAIQSFPLGRGTALPPADPKAIAKKKAEIASWPKS